MNDHNPNRITEEKFMLFEPKKTKTKLCQQELMSLCYLGGYYFQQTPKKALNTITKIRILNK